MNAEIFSKISEIKVSSEFKSFAEKVANTFDENRVESLAQLVRLSYLLHCFKEDEVAERFSEVLSELPFVKDRNYWIWIEFGIILNIRFKRLKNQESIVTALKNKILYKFEVGSELIKKVNRKAYERTLRGEGLPIDEIKEAIHNKNHSEEFSYRLIYLMKLYFIREMGGSKEFPIENVDKEIAKNLQKMRTIKSKVDFMEVIF